MIHSTLDDLESQLRDFATNGQFKRISQTIELTYPNNDIKITCKPINETNDNGTTLYQATIQTQNTTYSEKEANPDLLSIYIQNRLEDELGIDNL